jgi:transcriptional regulator with XRE-family HTH domain
LTKVSKQSIGKVGKVSTASQTSRALRKALGGITQAELAARLLISRNYVSQLEAGLKEPSDRLLLQMELMLTKATSRPSANRDTESSGMVREDPISADQLRAELRAKVERAIAWAGDQVDRLGWLNVQADISFRVGANISPLPGAGHLSPEILKTVEESERLAKEFHRQQGKGPGSAGGSIAS